MMTIHELKTLRGKLIERRRTEAHRIGTEHHDVQIAKMISAHHAIQALEAVIAEDEAGQPSIYETRGLRTFG